MKSRQPDDSRVYELVCASALDNVTEGPGPGSFTPALIGSLKRLLKKSENGSFRTKQLCDEINLSPDRIHRPCSIWQYNHQYRRAIEWAPLERTLNDRKRKISKDKILSLLDLRLSFSVDCPVERSVSRLATALCNAVKNIKALIQRIDMLELHHPPIIAVTRTKQPGQKPSTFAQIQRPPKRRNNNKRRLDLI